MPRERTARSDPDDQKPSRLTGILIWLHSDQGRTAATLIRMTIQIVTVLAGDDGPS